MIPSFACGLGSLTAKTNHKRQRMHHAQHIALPSSIKLCLGFYSKGLYIGLLNPVQEIDIEAKPVQKTVSIELNPNQAHHRLWYLELLKPGAQVAILVEGHLEVQPVTLGKHAVQGHNQGVALQLAKSLSFTCSLKSAIYALDGPLLLS